MLCETDNVILTGYGGFIGSIIFRRIFTCKLTRIGRAGGDLTIDLTSGIPDLTSLERVYCVIHAAGKAHFVPPTREDKEVFWKVNLEGTKNLCKGLEKSGNLPSNFVFISTVAVYGLENGMDIDESYSLNGASDYARSKIATEQWLSEWTKKHDIKLLILRLPLVAGSNPPGNLGAMIHGIKTGRYFRIGPGDSRKSAVLAEDVAEIIVRSIGKEGIYNLTDGYHPSFSELEDLIAAQLNKKPPLSIPLSLAKIAAKAGDILGNKFPVDSSRLSKITSTLTFSDKKARQELGWNPERVIDKFRIC